MSFPVDDATLNLLEFGIRNPQGDRSNLHGALAFLSGELEPHTHTDRCVKVLDDVWDCTKGRDPVWSVNDAILGLIDEIRRLRPQPARLEE